MVIGASISRLCLPLCRPVRHSRISSRNTKEKWSSIGSTLLRITVGIDNKHSVLAFQKVEDFNVGLMKVNSNVDAKIAAAAILSLSGTTHVSPGVIVAKEVRLTKGNGGWTCSVTRPRGFDGTVAFDAGGKCAKVAKVLNYIPPMPP